MKQRLHYNIVFRPEPEGGFTVIVPALPGCISYGKTLPQARAMAIDAINLYVQSLRAHREPVPTDDNNLLASVVVESTLPYAQTA